jgi:hypothetical protein
MHGTLWLELVHAEGVQIFFATDGWNVSPVVVTLDTHTPCYCSSDIYVNINQAELLYDRLNSKLKTYILKTKNTITLYNKKFEVQIITKLYNSVCDVFTHFDLDCCCVGYSNSVLYALPRFIRSLAYSGNIFDPDKQSPSYIHRLKKYTKRGFTLYIPGMNKNDPEYNKDNHIVKILREKTDKHENNSEYCDFFVFLKNRNNKEVSDLLQYFHNKDKFTDTIEIKNIDDIYTNININWDVNYNLKDCNRDEFYIDMYNSVYIR